MGCNILDASVCVKPDVTLTDPKYIRIGVGMAVEKRLGLRQGWRLGNKSLKVAWKHFASYIHRYIYI